MMACDFLLFYVLFKLLLGWPSRDGTIRRTCSDCLRAHSLRTGDHSGGIYVWTTGTEHGRNVHDRTTVGENMAGAVEIRATLYFTSESVFP